MNSSRRGWWAGGRLIATFAALAGFALSIAVPVAAQSADQESAPSADAPAAGTLQPGDAPPTGPKDIDFYRDIQPIFAARCYKCHGLVEQKGGLGLFHRDGAKRGGDSGRSLLVGRLEISPLWERVTSDDPQQRMPHDADPLSESELDRIKKWILADAPWPDMPPADAFADPGSGESWFISRGNYWLKFLDLLDAFMKKYAHLKLQAYVALGMFIVLLFVEAVRQKHARGELARSGFAGRAWSALVRLRPSYFLAVYFAWALWIGESKHQAVVAQQKNEITALERRLIDPTKASDLMKVYGNPPVPFRPSKLPEIHSTYYRGNCERDPKLFNGGNYRTATLQLGLFDANKNRVELGNTVGPGPLYVRLEIERAPGTASGFYPNDAMSRIFLSEHTTFIASPRQPQLDPVPFSVVKPDWSWEAYFPIGAPAEKGESELTGLVYVVRTHSPMQEPGKITGEPHYGIKFDLRFNDRTLVEGSDLWMGELFLVSAVVPPVPEKIPLCEWFDWRPLPVSTGTNTSDPKLLGLDPQTGRAPETYK